MVSVTLSLAIATRSHYSEQGEMMKIVETDLKSAIEHLYTVFNSYASNPQMGRGQGIDQEDTERLLFKPLRELTESDLDLFSTDSMSLWGDATDFKHFLPRLFELLAFSGGGGLFFEQILIGKLGQGNWREWPIEEQQAVEQYLWTLWTNILSGEDFWSDNVDDFLWGLTRADVRIRGYLEYWTQIETPTSAFRVAQYVFSYLENQTLGKFLRQLESRLGHPEPELREVVDSVQEWLLGLPVLEKLEMAAATCKDMDNAEYLRNAVEILKKRRSGAQGAPD
jgi:hypothetical protein